MPSAVLPNVIRVLLIAGLIKGALNFPAYAQLVPAKTLQLASGTNGFSEREPGNLEQALYEKAEAVFNDANEVSYEHCHRPAKDQVVCNGQHCHTHTDCSGFVSYVLHSVAPKQYAEVRDMQPRHPYPQARIYANFFGSLSSQTASSGWTQVASFRDLRRGDIIAWQKQAGADDHGGHGNSGHVMIVIDPPGEISQETIDGEPVRYVSVYVMDSSTVKHFPPESLPPLAHQDQRDGLGKGMIRLILDNGDRAIGYWEGTYWGEGNKDITHPKYSSMIRFGRLVANPIHQD